MSQRQQPERATPERAAAGGVGRTVAADLLAGLEDGNLMSTVVERLRQVASCDHARVMLVEAGSRLSPRAVFDGERSVALADGERATIDATEHPLLRQVIASAAPVVVSDLGVSPAARPPGEPGELASWMAVPLQARGEVIGLLTIARRRAAGFDAETVAAVETFAAQAALVIDNALLFAQVQTAQARSRALARRLVEGQERERRRVARELHDEAGQALASLRYGLRLLEREVAEGVGVGPRVAELLRTADAVIDGLHRLASDLRPASLDHLGVDAALHQYARSISVAHGLVVRFKARGFTGERLPAIIETALFRVVQEAVANVVRHAQATRVDVLLEHRGDRVLAMVEDDGIGFDPALVRDGEHLGLLGLRERADALGGRMTVESAPGAGTTVAVEVSSADPDPDR